MPQNNFEFSYSVLGIRKKALAWGAFFYSFKRNYLAFKPLILSSFK